MNFTDKGKALPCAHFFFFPAYLRPCHHRKPSAQWTLAGSHQHHWKPWFWGALPVYSTPMCATLGDMLVAFLRADTSLFRKLCCWPPRWVPGAWHAVTGALAVLGLKFASSSSWICFKGSSESLMSTFMGNMWRFFADPFWKYFQIVGPWTSIKEF